MRAVYANTRAMELEGIPWTEKAKRAFLDNQFDLQHRHFISNYPDAQWWVVLQPPLEHEAALPIGRYYVVEMPDATWVIDICLEPSSRCRGIGSALLLHTMHRAATRGRNVNLHVAHNNPRALQLYLRSGFVVIADTGSHLHLRWTPQSLG